MTEKFSQELKDSVLSMTSEQDIFTLDQEKMAKFSSSAQDSEKMQYFEAKFSQWISQINNLLNDDTDSKDTKDSKKELNDAPGPKVELEYWKTRMQKITGWCEQLRS